MTAYGIKMNFNLSNVSIIMSWLINIWVKGKVMVDGKYKFKEAYQKNKTLNFANYWVNLFILLIIILSLSN
jgi:hypothetical protein